MDRQADVLERFGAELDRLSKNIFRRDEPEGKASKRVPVSSALRLTLQDLGRVGDLLTRQRDCLVNLLRLLTYASNEEALDDTNSTLYIKLRPLSRDVTNPLPFQQRQLHAGRRSGPHQHRTERNR